MVRKSSKSSHAEVDPCSTVERRLRKFEAATSQHQHQVFLPFVKMAPCLHQYSLGVCIIIIIITTRRIMWWPMYASILKTNCIQINATKISLFQKDANGINFV